jgi:hypothetical protein
MNLFLRLVTLTVLVVPICMELRTATARNIEARIQEAGNFTPQDETRFTSDAQRRLHQALQVPKAYRG